MAIILHLVLILALCGITIFFQIPHYFQSSMQSNTYELVDVTDGSNQHRNKPTASGVPTKKPRLRVLDVVTIGTSISCCVLAIAVVFFEHLAWRLGYQYQLVLVGLMLSIMNICLNYALPFLLLLLEARFGRSTLQNYDAIIRNAVCGPQTDWFWRLILLATWLLPLGLSVAYKLFLDENNHGVVEYDDKVNFGFYALPGLEDVGASSGVLLMYNATLPFILKATASSNRNPDSNYYIDYYTDDYPSGLNTLSISGTAAAALDIPSPEFVQYAQGNLNTGERWYVGSTVLATVTRQVVGFPNTTITGESTVSWNDALNYPKTYDLTDNHQLWTAHNNGSSNQTWMAMSILPSNSSTSDFTSKAKIFTTQREQCNGTWAITSSSVKLYNGTCDHNGTNSNLDQSYQNVFTERDLELDTWYIPTLREYLGAFTNDSDPWLTPTMTATIAGMMYSRVTALGGKTNTTTQESSYPSRGGQNIYSTKPGISRSIPVLFLICLQPALLLATMTLSGLLYAVPVDRNFGLVSILAGVDRASLEHLTGASLSAKLRSRVTLDIAVHHTGESQSEIRYTVVDQATRRRQRAQRGDVYS